MSRRKQNLIIKLLVMIAGAGLVANALACV